MNGWVYNEETGIYTKTVAGVEISCGVDSRWLVGAVVHEKWCVQGLGIYRIAPTRNEAWERWKAAAPAELERAIERVAHLEAICAEVSAKAEVVDYVEPPGGASSSPDEAEPLDKGVRRE